LRRTGDKYKALSSNHQQSKTKQQETRESVVIASVGTMVFQSSYQEIPTELMVASSPRSLFFYLKEAPRRLLSASIQSQVFLL
jgi:hypothetical protein